MGGEGEGKGKMGKRQPQGDERLGWWQWEERGNVWDGVGCGGQGGWAYLGCEGGKAACRGLAGSPGRLRHLPLGGQVGSGVGGVPLLAGEG